MVRLLSHSSGTKLQPFEDTRTTPLVEVAEVRRRACRMTDVQLPPQPGILALVVEVAGRAVRRTEHTPRAAEQHRDPRLFAFLGHFHLARPRIARVADDRRDRLAGLGEVVRDVRDEVRTL